MYDWRLAQYGISESLYQEMVEARDGLCDLCGRFPKGRMGLHVDHDHQTGKVRGLICVRCNTGLGKLGDDIESLERAIAYLEGTDAEGKQQYFLPQVHVD